MSQKLMASLSLLLAGCASQAPQDADREKRQPRADTAQGQERTEQVSVQQPVIVTARKWEELARDVPRSLTTVSGSRIRAAGAQTVKDASYYVPNTLVTEFSSRRLSFPFVRGVGSGQGDPAVATYIDGVPQLTVSSTNLPLLNIERVEFLRGPHGSLYGRNTIGGVVHVLSRPPSNRTRIEAGFTAGNFSLGESDVSISTPLEADRLFLSGSFQHAERDGYTTNDFTGNDVDFRQSFFGRGQLLWTPDDQNDVRLVVYGEDARDGGFVLSDLDRLRQQPNRINQDFEGRTDRDIVAGALTWNHYWSSADFTSITGVQGWSIDESTDFDFSPIDLIRRFTAEEQTYVSQELRVASSKGEGVELGEDAELKWLVGASGFYSDSDRSAANEFRQTFMGLQMGTDRATGSFEDYALAAYGQLTLALWQRLELTAALRYDYESKDANIQRAFETMGIVIPSPPRDERESFDEVLPRFSLAYRWAEEAMTYVMAARGFKAGGFNLTAPVGQTAFGPETSWTLEAGAKTNFADDKIAANGSVFWIDWDDMQLSQFDQMSGGYVTNAGEATSQGFELELLARPLAGLEVFGGFGYLDTEFDRFVDQFGQDVSGRSLPFAPDTTGNLGAHYRAELTENLALSLHGEYFHVGQFFYDAGNRASERYKLANFRVGLGGTQWRIEAWVRNAFDEEYVPIAFQPNPADPSQFVGESAAPQTYGALFRLIF